MSDPDYIVQIKSAAGVAVNEIREGPMRCIGCGTSLGLVALQTIAPPDGAFAFRARFACAECGPKTATLSLMEEKGKA
jgi:hypothetical protein